MEIKILKDQFYRIDLEKDKKELSKKFNSNTVLRNNSNISIYKGEWIKFSVNNFKIHTVCPAESLADIAKKHKTTIERLKQDNCLETEQVFIGQQIKIF